MSDIQLDKISQITVPNEKGEEVTYELENTTYSPSANFFSDGNLEFSLTNDLGETETATIQNIAVGPHGHLYVDIESSEGLEFRANEDGTVTVIGIGSFSGTELVIPSKYQGCLVVEIGSGAFRGTGITSVIIPDSIINIGASAFCECLFLNNIQLGAGVIDIGASSFDGCSSLTSITIPDSVTSIGDYTFYNCSALTSIIIPNSVTIIGSDAFRNCDSLTSVVIPDSVTSIGEWAFGYCPVLTLYCKAESEPSGWHQGWNSDNRPVIWGFTGDFIAVNKKINKLAIGEWYSDYVMDGVDDLDVRQIRMYGEGVYEYYFRAGNGSISGNGMVYATVDNENVKYIARNDDDVRVYEFVQNYNGTVASVAIHFKRSNPTDLIFKMRKIRDI